LIHLSFQTTDKLFKNDGNIVEEFGEENIVQIMMDNKANYKAIGEIVMKNERSLIGPTCTHFVNLMLKDLREDTCSSTDDPKRYTN